MDGKKTAEFDHQKRLELIINTVVNAVNSIEPKINDLEFSDLLINLTVQFNKQVLEKNSQLRQSVKSLAEKAQLPNDPIEQSKDSGRENKE